MRSRTLVVLFVLLLPAVTSRLYASDEIQYFSFLRSLWFDRDLSFDNEYRHLDSQGVASASGFLQTNLERRTNDRALNFGTIGAALLWSPFYAAGHLAALTLRAFGSSVAVDGYSRPYVMAVCYGSAFYGFAALLIAQRLARRLIGEPGFAPLAIWFGTPLLFYMYLAPVFAHACSAFAVALFIMAWLKIRERWSIRGFATLGALAALMTMVREQDAFFVAGPAVDVLLTLRQSLRGTAPAAPRPRTLLLGIGAAAVAGLLVSLPQIAAYLYLNDRLGPSRLVARKMNWTAPHAIEVLFSPHHGLFFWTPLALLAMVGLLVLLVRNPSEPQNPRTPEPQNHHRRIIACLLIMFALQVYVAGSVESWTVAGAFGQRRFVSLTAILVIGLAALWQFVASWPSMARRATAVLVIVCVWWNLGLMLQFGTNRMDRQRLHVAENARQSFIALPLAAPSLVWRYFTDRASFYKQPPQ
jgi:uncharacterized membrane protein YuzA (DUF378 family)